MASLGDGKGVGNRFVCCQLVI